MNLKEKVRATSKILAEIGMTAASKDCNKENYKTYNEWIIKEYVSRCVTGCVVNNRPVQLNYKGLAAVTKMLALMISQKMIEADESIIKEAVAKHLNFFKEHGSGVTKEMYFWEKETLKYMGEHKGGKCEA